MNGGSTKIVSLAIAALFVFGSYLVFENADGTAADEQIIAGSSNDNVVLHITVMEKEKGSIWSGIPLVQSKNVKITFQTASRIWCLTGIEKENGDNYIEFRKSPDTSGSRYYLRPDDDSYVFGECGYRGTIIENKPFMIKSTDETIHIDVHFKDKNEPGTFGDLRSLLNQNDYVELGKDYVCGPEENGLSISGHKTINLNGYKIDRNLGSTKVDGYVFKVEDGGELDIVDTDESTPYKYGKICGGYSSEAGGGITVVSGGMLKIDSGSICNNYSENGGCGIYAEDKSSKIEGPEVVISGWASISYNTRSRIGGGILIESAKLTMTGGSLVYNESDNEGGGICVKNGGEIELSNDATILLNKAHKGGGISLSFDSTLTMDGGFISDNNADVEGGGIYIYEKCEFNMSGGIISNNMVDSTTEAKGGAIYSEGTVNITNGIIEKNASLNDGGGIYFMKGTIALAGDETGTGCVISENYSQRPSDESLVSSGIFFGAEAGDLIISGLVKITDNEIGYYDSETETWNNVTDANVMVYENASLDGELAKGSLIQIDDKLAGSPKIVLPDASPGTERYFTTGNTEDNGIVWVNDKLYIAPRCGTNVYWMVDDGVLAIAGIQGVMDDFGIGNDAPPWPAGSFTKVIISGTTNIGSYAFTNSLDLTSVDFGDEMEKIGESAFEGCSSLKSIAFPDSLQKIENNAFKNCFKINEITFAGDMTEKDFGDDSLCLGAAGRSANVLVKTNGWNPKEVLTKRIIGDYTTVHTENENNSGGPDLIVILIAAVLIALAVGIVSTVYFTRKRNN